MAREALEIGVVAVSRKPVTRWGRRGFEPSAVLPAVPQTLPGTRLGPEGDVEQWYLGPAPLELCSGDTGHYRDNLQSERPALWVAIKAGPDPAVACVTADPYEGEALSGDPGLVLAAVPMPEPIRARVAAFFTAHHVEEVFFKRKRDRQDPDSMGRRGRASDPEAWD